MNAKAKKRYRTRGEKPPSDDEGEETMDMDDITCPLDGALNCERKCIENLIVKGKTHHLQLRMAMKSDEKGPFNHQTKPYLTRIVSKPQIRTWCSG